MQAEPVPEQDTEATYDWLERNVAQPVLQAMYTLPWLLGPAVRELTPSHWGALLTACTALYESVLSQAKVCPVHIGISQDWAHCGARVHSPHHHGNRAEEFAFQ